MPLLDKQRRVIDTGRSNYAVFKRRRRIGALTVALLTVLSLGVLAYFLAGGSEQAVEQEPVEQAEAPAVEEASPAEEEAPEEPAPAPVEEEEAAPTAPPAPEDPTLFMTVPKLGVYGHVVRNDSSEAALDLGAIKVPSSGFPWEEEDTNTYVAGHRIGWPGTESYYQFYELPLMQKGDSVFLEDTNGTVYEYRVFDIFAVSPSQSEVTRPVAGKDVVSLQTCTESVTDWWTMGPGLYGGGPESGRLVVQAELV